jgi:hypothetical protein
MRITLACESCGHKLRIGDRHAGKKAKCRHCGHVFTIPAASEPVNSDPATAVPANGDADPELVITEAAPESSSDANAAALREIAESLRNIQSEIVRTRKMIFRLIFWPLILCLILGAWMWWSAANQQRQMEKLLDKGLGGNGDLNKMLKDLGL